ncbi:CMGC/MAPK/ERK1 protein kinase [Salpingoeca rosetta]|uniref:CMGC/MAPK/ERK1 protein kinase n=1 Tax=Salpingoeca rosetta (strain ATCC 50818 / BSB-021) TaxID=946362 RepID=F2US32_SALR5|nr:CMGC/MAPK/ERK1 protein kinase [Salpingoeca rosetta]EGD80437.1 CMGC/MAPK/ERK1 protein kinase [Salpingoeca rosetta]|eukprot:XP_004988001.1 CMGC/MAPK/ERK1 protein kinase [Salpingoeca rosetta]
MSMDTATDAAQPAVAPLDVQGRSFNITPRYQEGQLVGEGAYGMVISALDTKTGQRVAVKKVTPLTHQTFCQRTLREIILLSRLKHDNIVNLMNVIAGDEQPLSEVYLVLNLMETDLHKLLKSLNRRGECLSPSHTCFFLYQMFLGIKYIHSANVIHRDLKPGNMLINVSNCDLRICDFGLARVYDPTFTQKGELTEYVATRWYRAPEVMVRQRAYSKAMDIWSLGCILAEMLSNRAIFPGKNYLDQINKILDIIGSPDDESLREIPNERSRGYLMALPQRDRKDFTELYPQQPPHVLDLLQKLLEFSPSRRPTAEAALDHPYFEDYHDPADEVLVAARAFCSL